MTERISFRPLLLLAMLLALLVAAGCAHGTGTNETPPSDVHRGGADARDNVRPQTPPGHPPLAASPADLLEPGAREKVARVLVSKGFLPSESAKGEELTAAIRQFQESEGLAATGFPDDQTVRRLGIDPKEVGTSLETEPKADSAKGGSGHDTPPSDEESTSTGH